MKKLIKIIIAAVCAVALLLCALAAFAACMAKNYSDKTPVKDDADPVYSANGDRYNILVGGTDRTSGLTDVLMLVSADRKNKTVSVMQIPRDTYADYAKGSYKKINGAYGALGGGEQLCNFISEALGVTVDKYIIVSPDALCQAVDAVGGVEIELSEPLYYNDPYQGLTISLPKGKQTLDGKTAEQFIRYRSGYADGDLGRMDAQKVFLTALCNKVSKSMTPIALTKLASALTGGSDTDLSVVDAWELSNIFFGVKSQNIYFVTAPGEAVVAEKSGASYYSLSAKATEEILVKYFGAEAGGFDRKKVFLNKSYDSFSSVYGGYSDYKVYSASEIDAEGLRNARLS